MKPICAALMLLFRASLAFPGDGPRAVLVGRIVEAVRNGRRPSVFVEFSGSTQRGRLVAAGAEAAEVEVAGIPVPLRWADLPAARLVVLSRKCLNEEDIEGRMALLRFAARERLAGAAASVSAALIEDAPDRGEEIAAVMTAVEPPAPGERKVPSARSAAARVTPRPPRARPKERPRYVVNDFALYPVPRMPLPEKGVPFKDPHFDTTVVRITDRRIDGYHKLGEDKASFMQNMYSRYDCDNADGSYVLLHNLTGGPGGRPWHIYDGRTFKYLKQLPIRHAWSEPRWDWAEPHLLYYTEMKSPKLMQLNVTTGEKKLLRDFAKDVPGATRAWTQGEGDYSVDGMKCAFKTEGASAWLWYDRLTDEVHVREKAPVSDHVSTSMLGRFFTVGGKRGFDGIYSFTPDFAVERKLTEKGTHSDLAVDAEGNDVIVYQGASSDWIEMADLKTGKVTRVISIVHETSWRDLIAGGSGFHISGNCIATPGWVLVSTYAGKPFVVESWQHQMLYMLELKPDGRVWRVAHTHCPWDASRGKDYWAEAFAAINTEGTRVYWGSTWDRPEPANRAIETYVAELPETWYEDLMGVEAARLARARTRRAIAAGLGEAAARHYDRLIRRGR